MRNILAYFAAADRGLLQCQTYNKNNIYVIRDLYDKNYIYIYK